MHPSSFVDNAYEVVTIAVLIFVGLGIPVSALALGHALLQLRQHHRAAGTGSARHARHFGAASTVWPARIAFPAPTDTATFGPPPSSLGKGDGILRRGFPLKRGNPLKRDRGRFTITIERVVDRGTADLDVEGMELGESVAGGEGEDVDGKASWETK